MLGLDLPSTVFDILSRGDQWVTDDEVWRAVVAGLASSERGYANQIRDVVLRRKEEGAKFLMLYAVKEDRLAVLNFSTTKSTT